MRSPVFSCQARQAAKSVWLAARLAWLAGWASRVRGGPGPASGPRNWEKEQVGPVAKGSPIKEKAAMRLQYTPCLLERGLHPDR